MQTVPDSQTITVKQNVRVQGRMHSIIGSGQGIIVAGCPVVIK